MGSNPGSGMKCPRLLPGRCTVGCPLLQVCALGWVKCREHISLLIILCIIVYVTNKAHPSLICIVDIYDTDIYTDLHYKRKNIIRINDFLATLHLTKYIYVFLIYLFSFFTSTWKSLCVCVPLKIKC